jgi:hypothetical protein
MKIQSKLTAAFSIAALVIGPIAVAEDAAPAAPEVETASVETTDDAGKGEVVDTSNDGTVVEVTAVEDDPAAGGEGVPIDWVKRGGEGEVENPEIYYNMAAGGGPVSAESSNASARDLGQDENAAAIETKTNAAAPQIMSEKKEPVALIKKGRVFLR